MRPDRASRISSRRRGGRVSLSALLAYASLSTACASTAVQSFDPTDAPEDAATKDAAVVDTAPSIDAPVTPDVALDRTLDGPRVDVPRPLDAPCAADTMSDPANCGACGRACASTEICQFSICTRRPVDCPPTCAGNGECAGCARPGDLGVYCCMSGLCLYTSGATCPVLEDRPPGEEPEGPMDVMLPPSDMPSEAAVGDAPLAG